MRGARGERLINVILLRRSPAGGFVPKDPPADGTVYDEFRGTTGRVPTVPVAGATTAGTATAGAAREPEIGSGNFC